MSRFFVEASQIMGGEIIINDTQDLRHLIKVLRAAPGYITEVSDKSGWEYRAELVRFEGETGVFRILDKQHFTREPKLKVTLYQGIPKAAKMEQVIQKTVELGVSRIVPVFCSRTIATDTGGTDNKLTRWRKISAEAVKQCRRGFIPEIAAPVKLKDTIPEIASAEAAIFPYEDEREFTIKDFLRGISENISVKPPATVSVVIGPEGGFSDDEAAMLKGSGVTAVSLGKTVLRTETAGLAALSMVMYELEL
ncbi:MAG: 16S rRNA (uracil(1498)-N(3))-methyltransferase [Clostridiales Family XIII bacterium]|nr:16S rRNA (uracil(1498)-N(3))-methyltransferase [Clostridiales Family XIII bacterium]